MNENHLSMDPEDTFKERKFAKMLSLLPEKHREVIKKLPEENDRRIIIADWFSSFHPEGLEPDLEAELPILLKKATEQGVSGAELQYRIEKTTHAYMG